MKKASLFLLLAISFSFCKSKKDSPDVSAIKVSQAVERFDEDFFSMDTTGIEKGISNLQVKYPVLAPIFLQRIVGVDNMEGIKAFYRLYKPVFDSSQKIYKNFEPIREEIEQAFRYVKHYFPSYNIPAKLTTVVGPMNSLNDMAKMANGELTPNFIGPGFVGISLQFYLGKNFSLYNDEYFINNVAPLFRSRRFSREYIAADVMKLVADDIFPDKSSTKPLIEQMIEKGKQWWLMDKFLPGTPDYIKTGFSREQIEWCKENEGLIWTYIVKNENLYAVDPATTKIYIGEAPFTQGFSQEESPGNIGPWIGWQIVKKYADKHSGMKPEAIMKASAKQILEEAKYKPK
ncbi:MAG: gliding motility lipoprotein GldB [Chitinophagaceae bacterium]